MLVHRHLIACGYVEAATAMERECNVGLDKWEVADNIDLGYILQDFEEYFEMKFQKKPVLVRKNPNAGDEDGSKRLPPGQRLPQINSANPRKEQRAPLAGGQADRSQKKNGSLPPTTPKDESLGIEVTGKQIESKPKKKNNDDEV